MPNQKFIFVLALLAIILFGVNVKPELFGSIIKSFPASLTGSSLACNSPDLFKEFQRKFDERVANLKKTTGGSPDYFKKLERYALHIERTETLGQVGNSLSCSMDYTVAEGSDPETFKFLLGRDDDGQLVWHFDSRIIAPYNRPY
jgi:hypothetical protein